MNSRSHLSRGWKIAISIFCGGVVIAAGFEAYGWYYNHYAWPRKIQIELLGEVIVTHDTLRSRHKLSYTEGVVTIEEWWM